MKDEDEDATAIEDAEELVATTSPAPPTPQDPSNEQLRQDLLAEIRRMETWTRDQNAQTFERLRDHEQRVESEIARGLNVRTVIGGVVIFLIAVAGVWSVYEPLQRKMTEQIAHTLDEEFSNDRIRGLIASAAEKAASGHARHIVETRVEPAVLAASEAAEAAERASVEAESTSRKGVGELRTFIDETKQTYSAELEDLKSGVAMLRRVNEIRQLKADAVGGSAVAWDLILEKMEDEDKLVSSEAVSASTEITALVLNLDTTSLRTISKVGPDGTKVTGSEMSVDELLSCLGSSKDSRVRAKCAEYLGKKREYRVIKPLYRAFSSDPDTWVRGASMVSLSKLAGVKKVTSKEGMKSQLDDMDEALREKLQVE